MAILTHKCPHCLTEHIALRVISVTTDLEGWNCAAHLSCPKCKLPSCAHLTSDGKNSTRKDGLHSLDGEITSSGAWRIKAFWPEPPGPLVPEHLPTDVERIYLQAERNFAVVGNEEAAGTMYRKALDIGLRLIAPAVTGNLKARIAALVTQHILTQSLGEWADQIRLLGNDTAHEIDQPTRDELDALRNFSDLVLRYLFTLPAMVKARKAPLPLPPGPP